MGIEKMSSAESEMTLEEIQEFVNNPLFDLPETRRDISKPENLKWLSQNISIRNDVPREIVRRLKQEFLKTLKK